MQHRKAPIFLVGVVVFAIAGMTIWNATTKPQGIHPYEPVKQEGLDSHGASNEQRQANATALSEALPKSGQQKRPNGVMPESEAASGLAKEPTILLDKFNAGRPKPNLSSTATHWYDDKSNSARVSEENKKGGG